VGRALPLWGDGRRTRGSALGAVFAGDHQPARPNCHEVAKSAFKSFSGGASDYRFLRLDGGAPMKRLMRLSAASLLFSGIALLASEALGQQHTLKEQLVGTWTVVSLINETNGNKIEPFGPDPKGYFMFDSSGHFSTHIIRAYRPKFAHRDNPTPTEIKAVVEGTISAFGTYTVNEADHSIFMEIIGSSFPTWNNTYQKRFITITGDQMNYINPTPTTGGGTAMVILKRVE
jgi:hypothetical protein